MMPQSSLNLKDSNQYRLMSFRSSIPLIVLTVMGRTIGSSIPACGTICINSGFASTSCTRNDYTCACSDSSFINAVALCLAQSCGAADQSESEQSTAETCEALTGVSNLVILQEAVLSAQSVQSSATLQSTTSAGAQTTTGTSSSLSTSVNFGSTIATAMRAIPTAVFTSASSTNYTQVNSSIITAGAELAVSGSRRCFELGSVFLAAVIVGTLSVP